MARVKKFKAPDGAIQQNPVQQKPKAPVVNVGGYGDIEMDDELKRFMAGKIGSYTGD